jgi:hypothetical protein
MTCAACAARPFHQAALKNARHGSVSMDTLVSLGITAACAWSLYAMFVLDRGQAGVSAWYLLLHASGGGIYLEVAASVTTFLLAGRLYEAKARRRRWPGRRWPRRRPLSWPTVCGCGGSGPRLRPSGAIPGRTAPGRGATGVPLAAPNQLKQRSRWRKCLG